MKAADAHGARRFRNYTAACVASTTSFPSRERDREADAGLDEINKRFQAHNASARSLASAPISHLERRRSASPLRSRPAAPGRRHFPPLGHGSLRESNTQPSNKKPCGITFNQSERQGGIHESPLTKGA